LLKGLYALPPIEIVATLPKEEVQVYHNAGAIENGCG
jgi:hypothetical protein